MVGPVFFLGEEWKMGTNLLEPEFRWPFLFVSLQRGRERPAPQRKTTPSCWSVFPGFYHLHRSGNPFMTWEIRLIPVIIEKRMRFARDFPIFLDFLFKKGNICMHKAPRSREGEFLAINKRYRDCVEANRDTRNRVYLFESKARRLGDHHHTHFLMVSWQRRSDITDRRPRRDGRTRGSDF